MIIGPPNVAPYWFWMNSGLPPPAGWKYGVASSAEFRRNSNTLPWKALVPDFMVTLTTPPAACPNSAEKVEVWTLNSSMPSITGWMICAELPSKPRMRFLLSTPSSR